MTCSAYISSSI